MNLRLLLVDDNRLFRDALATMLNLQRDLTVVAALADGKEALRRVPGAKPDVVLVDQALRNGDALEFARKVRHESPETKVIVMGLLPLQDDVVTYVQAGVCGFVLKAATLEDFLHAIRSVAEGANVLPPSLTVSLFAQIVDDAMRRGEGQALKAVRVTKREREVVELIAAGMSNKDVANRLHLSTHTVRSHVHNILEKLALRSRLEIAAYIHAHDAATGAPAPHPTPRVAPVK